MTEQALELLAVVGVLSVVQSLFGVGLLLFGTPVLLLLDLPFPQVLAYLLPCSMTVSALQVAAGGGLTLEPIRRQFLAITAPAVLAATAAALAVGTPRQLKAVVGAVLLATAAARIGPAHRALARAVRRHTRALMLLLGVVHGWSNLGGGILTVIVGASFEDKHAIRRHVAFAYGLMACIQLAVVLATARPQVRLPLALALPVVAGGVFLLLGQRTFHRAPERAYQVGLTALVASFGTLTLAAA